MATYAGWEGVLLVEGDQTREILTESSAGGSNVVYYTSHWPIVDASGNVTDDPADITVYDNGSAMANDGSAYTVDGSEGKITIISATAGHQYDVTYKSKETVGCWQGVDLEQKNNLKVAHVGGQREPYDIKEGPIEISLKFHYLYIDSRAMRMATGKLNSGALPEFTVTVKTKSSGGAAYEVSNVKIDASKLSLKYDDLTGYDVDAVGKSISVSAT